MFAVPAAGEGQGGPLLRDEAAVRATVVKWNRIAVDASGRDHTYATPEDPRVFGEQLGPGRSARAMAIVHIAIFEVVNATFGAYESYVGLERFARPVALTAGIAQAAHDTLVALFPAQSAEFDAHLAADLQPIPSGGARDDGVDLGRHSAAAILSLRAGDGSHHSEPRIGVDYFTSDAPGHWRRAAVGGSSVALGARWGSVRPFVLERGSQFRTPPPPDLASAEYTAAFDEVRALGGDGQATPTVRTDDESHIGVYWAYDGMPSLCAPPRLYNQIAMTIAESQGTSAVALARMLALLHTAMADAGIAIWESKYFYDLWRPITGIREADEGTGPSGAGDGNPLTRADTGFIPLGAPSSNLAGPNFTPPFPSYPSGHAGFGGVVFELLRNIYGRDDITFTFMSDEFNGVTVDYAGVVRPTRAPHLRLALPGRGGERPESYLPRHSLGVRQDCRHRPGPADCRLRLCAHLPSGQPPIRQSLDRRRRSFSSALRAALSDGDSPLQRRAS